MTLKTNASVFESFLVVIRKIVIKNKKLGSNIDPEFALWDPKVFGKSCRRLE